MNQITTGAIHANRLSEATLLDRLINDECSRIDIFPNVSEEMFYDAEAKSIYAVMLKCWAAGVSINSPDMETLYGNNYDLFRPLLKGDHAVATTDQCIRNFEVQSKRCLFAQAMADGNERLASPGLTEAEISEVMADTRQLLSNAPVSAPAPISARDALGEAVAALTSKTAGVWTSWGMAALDKQCPMFAGQLAMIGARPGQGKTSLVVSCMNGQVDAGIPTGLICLEDQSRDMFVRAACQRADIAMTAVRMKFDNSKLKDDFKVSKEDIERYQRHCEILADRPAYFASGKHPTWESIKNNITRMAKEWGCRWVYVDYLQKIPSEGLARDKRLQIDVICRTAEELAQELGIVICMAAQLNRSAAGQRPRMENLKESGGIEECASVIVLIDNPKKEEEPDDFKGTNLYVAKNRNGETGCRQVNFHAKPMLFR